MHWLHPHKTVRSPAGQPWGSGRFLKSKWLVPTLGGRLQLVLMRHPSSYLSKLGGGVGAGGAGVGGRGGGGLAAQPGGGAARNPLLPHAYLKGVCVSGGMGV